MVGRIRENRLNVQGIGSSPDWAALIEAANVPVGLDIGLQADPYLPTDSASFYNAGIPTANLFSGAHEDYHRPSDTPERLDYEGLARCLPLCRTAGAARGQPPRNSRPSPGWNPRSGAEEAATPYARTRAPSRTTQAKWKGLLLGNVVAGGPAAEAGLRGGDVIVEFAGQAVTNIYDYTYALDNVKVDVPVEVVILRDGERRRVMLTPRARR